MPRSQSWKGWRRPDVTLVSKMGSPINQPLLRIVQISGDTTLTVAMESKVDTILNFWLESTDALAEQFVRGSLIIY
jgi:S-adenosylmethionine synthetase